MALSTSGQTQSDDTADRPDCIGHLHYQFIPHHISETRGCASSCWLQVSTSCRLGLASLRASTEPIHRQSYVSPIHWCRISPTRQHVLHARELILAAQVHVSWPILTPTIDFLAPTRIVRQLLHPSLPERLLDQQRHRCQSQCFST